MRISRLTLAKFYLYVYFARITKTILLIFTINNYKSQKWDMKMRISTKNGYSSALKDFCRVNGLDYRVKTDLEKVEVYNFSRVRAKYF